MTERDDIDMLGAEYVLGTLDAAERAEVAARRQREPALDAAIRDWEHRLGPLAAAVQQVEPPPGLFARIERQLGNGATQPGSVTDIVQLGRRLSRWRTAAIAASAVAASLALVLGVREATRVEQPRSYVAVLQKDAASPAFLLTVDLDAGLLTVRQVAADAQPGRSYELWLVHDALGAPRSLGLIGEGEFTVRPALAAYEPGVVRTATYAVSLEPAGGSQTGAPTGPVLFAGKLVQATR